MSRKKSDTPDTTRWEARLSDMFGAAAPSRATAERPKFVYVGPPSTLCGTDHKTVLDPATDSFLCSYCQTPLERKLAEE